MIDFGDMLGEVLKTAGPWAAGLFVLTAMIVILWHYVGSPYMKQRSSESEKQHKRKMEELETQRAIWTAGAQTAMANKQSLEISERMQEAGHSGLKIINDLVKNLLDAEKSKMQESKTNGRH